MVGKPLSQAPGNAEAAVQSFMSDGVEIAYLDEGAGDPVLLIHGFASNTRSTGSTPGWVRLLTGDGFRVISMTIAGTAE